MGATLDWPTAPGIKTSGIRSSICDPRNVIFWPPTYEGAPYTLRVVSFDEPPSG